MEKITQLLNNISSVNKKYEDIAKASGENFNIFSIIRVESNEVKTHSRFITELLNPKGRHGQDDLFLKLFLAEVEIENFETKTANVYIEYYVGIVTETKGGRIDILIKNGQNQVICIENKIYAEEQQNQLLRYSNAFPNNEKASNEVLFLTLRGDKSENDKSFQDYKSISYQDDIIKWLEECQGQLSNKSHLKEALQQYTNLVKKLTRQNMNHNMNHEIIQAILKDEESFNAFISLNKAKNSVYKTIMNEVFFPIFDNIEKNEEGKSNLKLTINKAKILDKSGYHAFYFSNQLLSDNNVHIGFQFDPSRNLFFGFNKKEREKECDLDGQIINRFNTAFQKSKTTDGY
jgi:hypothetical protein